MAASGVAIQDEVVTQFNNTKLKHMYRYIVLKLTPDWKEIEVEKKVESSTYAEFIDQLPKNDCRYAIYDFQFNVGDGGQREQLIFIVWWVEREHLYLCTGIDICRKSIAAELKKYQNLVQSTVLIMADALGVLNAPAWALKPL